MYNDYLNPIIKTISYPDAGLGSVIEELLTLCKEHEDVTDVLNQFKSNIDINDLEKLRENYTTTFDLKAMACLDIGYVLFGEDYKRGAFLVEIQRLQRENGIDPGSELPDHLPNFLKLLAVLPDGPDKKELVEKIFMPALSKILGRFKRDQTNKNYYRFPLEALRLLSEKEFKMNDTVLKGAY
jgi:nitrate reductase molybdenum cofactor assembly chaperone